MALDDTPAKTGFKAVGGRPLRPDGVDKVTGRARFGADMTAPGMLIGAILRSPHPHARIRAIDVSKALAAPGVKAVVTRDDFDYDRLSGANLDILRNCMARDKALYDGHAVAAVAATSAAAAKRALKLIAVDYEILPHVTDVDAAMAPDAPILHEDMRTQGASPAPERPSNVSHRFEFGHGDLEAGFAAADVVIERDFKVEASHQGYIEPHACLATLDAEGRGDIWVCTQGHYMVRNTCAELLGLDVSQLRATASEIGGGFGGKTTVFMEPVALKLSQKAGRPVKLVMTREEVFRATGPTSSASMRIKVGATKDGTITAADAEIRMQGGAFVSSPVEMGTMAAFACYRVENVRAVGYDVVTNRPKAAAYRAPGAPISAYGVENVMSELAGELGIDPLDFRLKNCARQGDRASYGPVYGQIGLEATLKAAKDHPHYKAARADGEGRGVACGFWFNFGGQTCVSLNVNADGGVALAVGTPDIGGSRASMCLMAAEALGIPYERVRAIVADTASLGYNDVTDGSRVTFASGLATIKACREAIGIMCARAAAIWDIPEDAVVWEDGCARPAGPNAGDFEPLSMAEIAARADSTGGPIAGHCEVAADGAGVGFGVHIADVAVDRETGRASVTRYTAIQDAGKAVHPSYVEGQLQGGAAQGIGWALNEEYIYGEDGRLQNPGFLDYRIPVCSDLPMIDTVILEIPNEGHPYGVRGVGEVPIVPPMACVGDAIANATGIRLRHAPMSPPRLLAALEGG